MKNPEFYQKAKSGITILFNVKNIKSSAVVRPSSTVLIYLTTKTFSVTAFVAICACTKYNPLSRALVFHGNFRVPSVKFPSASTSTSCPLAFITTMRMLVASVSSNSTVAKVCAGLG